MKKNLLCLMTILSISLTSNFSFAQIIANGDFETQYPDTPPSNPASNSSYNIKGYNNPNRLDQLPSWTAVPTVGSTTDNVSNYIATNATTTDRLASSSNRTLGGSNFSPHSGRGCVVIGREPGTYRYDGMITQQVSLIQGHTYQASFYVLRRPTGHYKSLFSFSVVNSTSVPSHSASDNSSNISPSPYSTITSDYITSDQNWTLVSGTFIAQSDVNNSWIVVGYATQPSVFDTSLPNYPDTSADSNNNTIDDVSLVDMGCASPSVTIPTPHYYCNAGCASYPPTQGYATSFSSVPAGTYTIDIATQPNVTYSWQAQSDGPWYLSSATNTQAVVTLNNNQRAQFTITTSGAPGGCNASYTFTLAVYGGYHYAFGPNPSTSELTVSAVEDQQSSTGPTGATNQSLLKASQAPTFEAKLYDSYGALVKTQQSQAKESKVVFNTLSLPNGLYTLRVGTGKGALVKQIQISH